MILLNKIRYHEYCGQDKCYTMLLADVQRCPDLQCIVGVFSLFSPMFRAGHAFFFLASPCHHQEKISQFGLPLPSSVDPKTGEGAGSTLPSSHPNTGEGSAVPYLLHWRASPAGSVVKLNRSIFDAVTRTNKLCIPSSGYNLLYIVRYYMILLTLLC